MSSVEQHRLEVVEQTLALYDLAELYRPWLERNVSSELSYHGQQHLAVVAIHAHRLAEEYLESSDEALYLFLAGLYHDYNHTGDASAHDSKNILKALEAWRAVAHEFSLLEMLKPVAKLIMATEHDSTPATVAETIIREADYAYVLEPDKELWYDRLTIELGVPVTEESTNSYLSKLKFRYLAVKS